MEKFNGHTELPWKTFIKGTQIGDKDAEGICAMWRCLPDMSVEQNKEGLDNAAFIVEACNSYYDLKERNAELVECLKAMMPEKTGFAHSMDWDYYNNAVKCSRYFIEKNGG